MSWDELKHNAASPQPDASSDAPSAEDPSERSGQDPVFGYYCTGTVKPAAHQRQGLFVLLALLMILLCAVLSLLMNLRVQIKRDDGQIVLQIGNGEKKATSSAADDSSDETQSALAVPAPAATGADSGVSLQISGADDTQALTLQQIYAKVIPSVVSITSQTSSGEVTGTGIIMTADGYIITNCHVIEGGDTPQVLLQDDDSYQAAVIGSDETSDLAVLKIDADGLTPAEFGDSDALQVGDAVVAIGDPLGTQLRGTMTDGIISAINRDLAFDGRTMTLLQTNAALNSGNSGGPLINMQGQVIGINTMKLSAAYSATTVEGLGFAIPISTAKSIVDELLSSGYVAGRPAIGITGETVPVTARAYYRLPAGVYIRSIDKTSDAYARGLRPGDIITAINGTSITSMDDLNAVKNQCQAGDTAQLRIYRSGVAYELDVVLMDAAGKTQ